MTTLTIESVKQLPKSIAFKAGGVEYMAKKETGITAGMTINAEVEDSDYNGKIYHWIKKFKPVASSHQGPANGGGGAAWLPFASNTVAHAINAGLIKEPTEVKQWAAAAKQAFEELTA